MLNGLGGDTAVTGNKVQVPAFGSGLGQAGMGYGNVVRMVRGRASRHRRHDVCIGRNVGSLQVRCGRSRGFWRFWCGAGVRVCQTFSGLSCLHLRRLHFVISDFRPPSVAESCQGALRRLPASRAIGVYSLTSDDPAPGSLTVFQSSRVARPQDASQAPYKVSLLSSSARSYLDAKKLCMLRPVSEVAGRHIDSVFHHSWRHYVGFVRDPVKAASVGFVEDAVEHVGFFSLPRRLELRGLLLMRVQATGIF